MKSVPILVRSGDDTVAAVVTVPETTPTGLVVVLAGVGRHVVIGGSLAALVARPLAAQGLAVLRLDHVGVGDSTGVVSTWTPTNVTREAEAARTSVAAVSEALGVRRFVTVGTCFGSRVALELASDPDCVGTVCLAPPTVDSAAPALARRTLGKRTLVNATRAIPVVRNVLKPAARYAARRRPSAQVLQSLSHLDHARIVFLYGQPGEDDHYDPRGLEALNRALSSRPEAERARFSCRLLDCGPLTIFDGLDAAAQDEVVQTIAREVVCFAASPAPNV